MYVLINNINNLYFFSGHVSIWRYIIGTYLISQSIKTIEPQDKKLLEKNAKMYYCNQI